MEKMHCAPCCQVVGDSQQPRNDGEFHSSHQNQYVNKQDRLNAKKKNLSTVRCLLKSWEFREAFCAGEVVP